MPEGVDRTALPLEDVGSPAAVLLPLPGPLHAGFDDQVDGRVVLEEGNAVMLPAALQKGFLHLPARAVFGVEDPPP